MYLYLNLNLNSFTFHLSTHIHSFFEGDFMRERLDKSFPNHYTTAVGENQFYLFVFLEF
jgi:hypothetical protein